MKFVRNPDFVGGLASSVKAGIAAVPADADGAVVCLGDMPLIDAHLIDRLIEAFAPDRGNLIAVPVSDGRRGNPVLWSRRFFGELMTLDGDIGARHLIAGHGEAVAEVPVEGRGAFLDIDTPAGAGSASGRGEAERGRNGPRAPGEASADLIYSFTKLKRPLGRIRGRDLGGGDFDRFD